MTPVYSSGMGVASTSALRCDHTLAMSSADLEHSGHL